MPDSNAGISFTVAMALSCQIAVPGVFVYSSYGFVVPDSCAGVLFNSSYGFVMPDSMPDSNAAYHLR